MEHEASEIMNQDAMARLMADDASRCTRAEAALHEAQRTYRDHTHRSRHASDEAHEVALKDFLPELEAAERQAEAVARSAEKNTRRVRAQTEHAGIAAAAARHAMIAADVARMPLDRVAADLRAAIARDDRPTMFLYARHPARSPGDPGSPRRAPATG